MPLFMVFDVESIGLHGEGFAVGWVVVDGDTGEEMSQGILACDPHHALPTPGDEDGWKWVIDNIPKNVFALNSCVRPRQLRTLFWTQWQFWKGQGARLAADVPWPVEANFLSACIRDYPLVRGWEGPYPLIDVASVRLAAGFDPLANEPRVGLLEEPPHNPQADARHSARQLVEARRAVRMAAF
jgi:hypothetical protein